MLTFNKAVLFAMVLGGAALPAHAGQMILNGGFEDGSFAGWNKTVQADSQGDVQVLPNNGSNSPISGTYVYPVNAEGGAYFAMTDQTGPGSYALTQTFTANGRSSVKVQFQLFAHNQAFYDYLTPPYHDHTVFPNQHVVVDILTGSAAALTSNDADVVASLYGPKTDGNGDTPWISYAFDLGVLAAGEYQFRFAQTDNMGFLEAGIDNVSVITDSAEVPEPATLALLGCGLAGMLGARRRTSKAA